MGSAVDLQENGATVVIYGEIDDPAMRYFNPSIAFHRGELKIAIRSCNFAVERGGEWRLRDGGAYSKTDVVYGDLDPDTLAVSNLRKLTLSKDAPTRTLVSGLEDARLFSRKDGMHAIGFESDRLTRSLHNSSTALAEYVVEGGELKYIRTLGKPNKEVVEKNWQPTDEPSENFDFTYSPTQVWKDGGLIGDHYRGQVHGGSQLLKQADGSYLSIVHDKTADRSYGLAYDRQVYLTYLAKHDSGGMITKLSKPFRFGTHENIEFASGMVEHEGHFLISIGIRDCKFAIAKIDRQKLMSLFGAES